MPTPSGISTLLVANRGEIAVRIIRAARELGIRTVQVYSEADVDSLPVRLADVAIEIGPPPAIRSYLNIDGIIAAAKQTGADAIHPGYGFLAESATFAEAVTSAGMKFVGPSANAIRLLGDKVAARNAAIEAGVPVVPGSNGRVDSFHDAQALAKQIGFPVMIKAAAGGGGRGIRIINSDEEFARQFPQASAEATAAFGDGGLYLEKVINQARHIEVQVLGDGQRVVHCYERECSLQRRRQKIWEEAPSVILPEHVRQAMCAAAVLLADAVNYQGAGTVEFLYDEATETFYFIEMNTRIQVEHPVTEMITGIDLVREMISIASGVPISVEQDDIGVNGHAIECRINAEDPDNQFFPSPGVVEELSVPGGPGVRFDTALYAGHSVPPYYDSLLGKLIVWGENRNTALARLRGALSELVISGVHTTTPLHRSLAMDDDITNGRYDTQFLERWLDARQFSANEQNREVADQ